MEECIEEMHSSQGSSSENGEVSHSSFEKQLLEEIKSLRRKLKEVRKQMKVLSASKGDKGKPANKRALDDAGSVRPSGKAAEEERKARRGFVSEQDVVPTKVCEAHRESSVTSAALSCWYYTAGNVPLSWSPWGQSLTTLDFWH